jgi:hypothetical protein
MKHREALRVQPGNRVRMKPSLGDRFGVVQDINYGPENYEGRIAYPLFLVKYPRGFQNPGTLSEEWVTYRLIKEVS